MLSIQWLKRKYKGPSAFIHMKKWWNRYLESQEGIYQPILITASISMLAMQKNIVAARRGSPEGLHVKSVRKADKSKGWFSETPVPASSSGMLVKTVIAYIESICPIFFSGNTCMHLCMTATRRRWKESRSGRIANTNWAWKWKSN